MSAPLRGIALAIGAGEKNPLGRRHYDLRKAKVRWQLGADGSKLKAKSNVCLGFEETGSQAGNSVAVFARRFTNLTRRRPRRHSASLRPESGTGPSRLLVAGRVSSSLTRPRWPQSTNV